MKRLAFAVMTGVGFYLHKEWRKRKQLQLSESNLRQSEKLLYSHFKDLVDYGFELDEKKNKHNYLLTITNRQNVSFTLNLRPRSNLKCLLILKEADQPKMVDMNNFLEERGYQNFPIRDYKSFDDYLKVLSSRIKSELVEGYKG